MGGVAAFQVGLIPYTSPPPAGLTVQSYDITISSGVASATQTISSVVTGQSIVLLSGYNTNYTGSDFSLYIPRVELTNSTTVTLYRGATDTSTVTASVVIIQFDSSQVASVQRGTITIAGGSASGTATISAVNTTNAAVIYQGYNITTATAGNSSFSRVDLTNSTTVTATRNASAATTVTLGYTVVEFAPSAITSIQQRSVTYTSVNTTDTDTISSVTTGNCLLVHNGGSGNNANNSYYGMTLTNSTTVSLARNSINTNTRTANYVVIEFAPGVLASRQQGTINSTGTTGTATITAVGSKGFAYGAGFYCSSVASPAVLSSSIKLNSSVQVGSARGTATGTMSSPWQAIEFS